MKKSLYILLAVVMLLSLAACGQSTAAQVVDDAAPADEIAEEIPEVTYEVSVSDPDGNPIPDVMVQFCDDVTCTTGGTDKNGTAVFTGKDGSYKVQVLKVPEGFVGTEEEFTFPDTGREISITLEIPKPATDHPIFGFSFFNPEKFENTEGIIDWVSYRVNDYVYDVYPMYYKAGDFDNYAQLFDLLCVQKDDAEAEKYLRENIRPQAGWDAFTLEKVGSVDGMTCFLVQRNLSEEDLESYKDAFGESYDEYISLRNDKETFLSGIKLYEPTGENFLFETQDMDGNAYSLADVLAGHKVTMINFWATWCGPCVNELPQLEKLSKSFEEKDCQIIGICTDLYAGSDTSEAQKILTKAGVTYLNLVAPENDEKYYMLNAYPTSYFVDSEGNILTEPVVGADIKGYSKALKTALAALEG